MVIQGGNPRTESGLQAFRAFLPVPICGFVPDGAGRGEFPRCAAPILRYGCITPGRGPPPQTGNRSMSFVRTLATLAAGFAAAKGFDKYNQMGGMAGVQDALKKNPQTAQLAAQAEAMLGKLGGSGGGLGGILGALGGMGAAASAGMTGMIDQITGTTAATDAAETNARLMIRAMIQAARADGQISDTERKVIMQHLGESTPEERAFVEAELMAPVDPLALARDTADAARAQVYSAAVMTVQTDTPAEAAFLSSLAGGLGLDGATVAGIHAALGKPAPRG